MDSCHQQHRKREEKQPAHEKVTKQCLSDYAQEDWPDMTKQLTSRHDKASSGKDY
jgi:hypothetical protein